MPKVKAEIKSTGILNKLKNFAIKRKVKKEDSEVKDRFEVQSNQKLQKMIETPKVQI